MSGPYFRPLNLVDPRSLDHGRSWTLVEDVGVTIVEVIVGLSDDWWVPGPPRRTRVKRSKITDEIEGSSVFPSVYESDKSVAVGPKTENFRLTFNMSQCLCLCSGV